MRSILRIFLFEVRYRSLCAKYDISMTRPQLEVLVIGYMIESKHGIFSWGDLVVGYRKLGLRVVGKGILKSMVKAGKLVEVDGGYRVGVVCVSFLRELAG